MNRKTSADIFQSIGWIALPLLAAAAIYFPGLDSLFLLDDQANLKDLADIPSRGIEFFLFGSSAGPGGRPLSLLTFALQHESWPNDPFAFKLVNLILHLCNGILVFMLCRKLGGLKAIPGSAGFAALVTSVWLLHPMQLSTVLYVVQRMSILSTLFMLVGMLIYLTGRMHVHPVQSRMKTALIGTGVMVCMILAVMGKETGVLLGLYVLVIEFTLLPAGPGAAVWRKMVIPFLLLPLVLTALYLFRDINGFLASFQIRDFTVGQRLLTEFNVLIDYLHLILFPVTGAFSVFHDDYPVATGLLSPVRTLFSVILLSSLCLLAFRLRRRLPIVSFAIGWFLAGHVLESSFLGLELYFEHRNYLASLGPILLVCAGLAALPVRLEKRRSGLLLASIWPIAVLMVTVMEINLWKNPQLQAHEWVREHPDSKRALNHMLGIDLILGNSQQATDTLERLRQLDKEDLYPRIKYITITNCYENNLLSAEIWSDILAEAQTAKFRGTALVSELNNLVYLYAKKHCAQLETEQVSGLLDILLANAALKPVHLQLYGVAADFAWIRGAPDEVVRYLDRALDIAPRVDRQLFKLRALMAGGHIDAAAVLLTAIENDIVSRPRDRLMYATDLQEIKDRLQVIRNSQQ